MYSMDKLITRLIVKKIVYVDMDGVVADFAGKWERMYGRKIDPYHIPPTPPGFYRDLELIPDAYDAVNFLNTKFNVYFLSTAEWENPSSFIDKRLWIDEKFGSIAYKKLILSNNKSLNLGNYLIDDRTANGSTEFSGEFIHFGSPKFPNWKEVLKYLSVKENF
jgi:5'-nucleotidase